MASILIVEDEPDLQTILQFNLTEAGHTVHVAADLAQARAALRRQRPDLVVLDLMLPDGSGTDLCRQLLRDPGDPPIAVLILSAKDAEIDRVVGFELGADDYVTKPFSLRELLLRVEALLRRRLGPPPVVQSVTCAELAVDLAGHRCTVSGMLVDLTAVEFKLLALLLGRRDRVQTRQTLLDEVWPGTAIDDRTVDVHIKRLREKLGNAARLVQTVRGVGYVLSADAMAGTAP